MKTSLIWKLSKTRNGKTKLLSWKVNTYVKGKENTSGSLMSMRFSSKKLKGFKKYENGIET